MTARSKQAVANVKKANRALYDWYKDSGICPRCKRYCAPGKVYCEQCLKEDVQRHKRKDPTGERKYQYDVERKAKLREQGICTKCGRGKAMPGIQMCRSCRQKNIERIRALRIRKKLIGEAKT